MDLILAIRALKREREEGTFDGSLQEYMARAPKRSKSEVLAWEPVASECVGRLLAVARVVAPHLTDDQRRVLAAIFNVATYRAPWEGSVMEAIAEWAATHDVSLPEGAATADIPPWTTTGLVLLGEAGSGKTTVLRAALETFEIAKLGAHVAAPTGAAASHFAGFSSSTLHRAAGIGIDGRRSFGTPAADFASVLFIDEISMVPVELLQAAADALGCRIRPFGGKRVILVGDFGQLPPPTGLSLASSSALATLAPATIRLRQNMRAGEGDWSETLRSIRSGGTLFSVAECLRTWHVDRALAEAVGVDMFGTPRVCGIAPAPQVVEVVRHSIASLPSSVPPRSNVEAATVAMDLAIVYSTLAGGPTDGCLVDMDIPVLDESRIPVCVVPFRATAALVNECCVEQLASMLCEGTVSLPPRPVLDFGRDCGVPEASLPPMDEPGVEAGSPRWVHSRSWTPEMALLSACIGALKRVRDAETSILCRGVLAVLTLNICESEGLVNGALCVVEGLTVDPVPSRFASLRALLGSCAGDRKAAAEELFEYSSGVEVEVPRDHAEPLRRRGVVVRMRRCGRRVVIPAAPCDLGRLHLHGERLPQTPSLAAAIDAVRTLSKESAVLPSEDAAARATIWNFAESLVSKRCGEPPRLRRKQRAILARAKILIVAPAVSAAAAMTLHKAQGATIEGPMIALGFHGKRHQRPPVMYTLLSRVREKKNVRLLASRIIGEEEVSQAQALDDAIDTVAFHGVTIDDHAVVVRTEAVMSKMHERGVSAGRA
jgi:hypothetical protein